MTIHYGQNVSLNFDRRIGSRHPVGLVVDWAPVDPKRPRRRQAAHVANATDVSVSGLGFESRTIHQARRGTPVRVTIGELDCTGTIRSARPAVGVDRTHYGVEIDQVQTPDGSTESIIQHLSGMELDGIDHTTTMSDPFDDSYYRARLRRKMEAQIFQAETSARSPRADWSLDR